MQDNPAASVVKELQAAARDALRMGSQWAHTAFQWVDERRNEMNNRNRGHDEHERERAQYNRYSTSGYGSDEGDDAAGQRGADQQHNQASGLSGGRRGESHSGRGSQGRERDVQGSDNQGTFGHSQGNAREYSQHGSGPEGAHGQSRATSPEDRGGRGAYAGYGQSDRNRASGSSNYASQGHGLQDQGGQGYESDYTQSHGYGAQGRSEWGSSSMGAGSPMGLSSMRSGSVGSDSMDYGSQQSSRSGGGSGAMGYRGLGPKSYTRSDDRIREDLNERLTDADDIDASAVSVDVSSGIATLTGSVDHRWMKHRAEDIAESCSGVCDVNNQLKVRSQSREQQSSLSSSGLGHAGSSAVSAGTNQTGAGGTAGHRSASSGASRSAGSSTGSGSSGSTPQ